MSLVHSGMVNVSVDPGRVVTLEDYINDGSNIIPISLFGKTVSGQLINDALYHIKSIGGGRLSVPIPSGYTLSSYPSFVIHVERDSGGGFFNSFQVYALRHPIDGEERPYGGEWSVGDIIHNSNVGDSDTKCMGWVCTSRGVPGTWESFGDVSSGIVNKVIDRVNRNIEVDLLADLWSDTAPYTQRVYNPSITREDYPAPSYVIEKEYTPEMINQIKTSFGYIDGGTTYDGYIDFTCSTHRPTVDMKVVLKCILVRIPDYDNDGFGDEDKDINFTVDSFPVLDSPNPVSSGGVRVYIDNALQGVKPYVTMTKLKTSGWSSMRQTVQVKNVSSDGYSQMVYTVPVVDSGSSYRTHGIDLIEQGFGTLTFQCTSVPDVDIDLFVVVQSIVTD